MTHGLTLEVKLLAHLTLHMRAVVFRWKSKCPKRIRSIRPRSGSSQRFGIQIFHLWPVPFVWTFSKIIGKLTTKMTLRARENMLCSILGQPLWHWGQFCYHCRRSCQQLSQMIHKMPSLRRSIRKTMRCLHWLQSTGQTHTLVVSKTF